MKKLTSLIVLLLLAGLVSSEAQRQRRGGNRSRPEAHREVGDTVYATADDGTPLKWRVFPATGAGPHPAVLVIHGGGFVDTPSSPQSWQCARDLAAEGFNAFMVEYRLADARGALPGQKSSGRFPEQTNDLKQAVRAARKYPGGNGMVAAIGGSAGGAHDVFLAATGTKGDDRLDAAVAFSGAFDFTDPGSSGYNHFRRMVENYSGSARVEDLRKASPITYVDASVSPLYLVASDSESMPPQQMPDLVRKLKELGVTNYVDHMHTNSQRHAFSNWPLERDQVLAFLRQHLNNDNAAADAGSAQKKNALPAAR